MDFDLISGYSARISWPVYLHADVVECSAAGFLAISKCADDEKALVVVNLQPNTTYTVKLTGKDGAQMTSQFTTCPSKAPRLDNLYASTKRADGVHDTTRFDKATHDVFMSSFSTIVACGDKILAPVSLRGVRKEILTTAVTDGQVMQIVDESSIFLPFSESKKDLQTVTLRDGAEESTLAYEPSSNAVAYGGSVYEVGDTFEIFGKMITVGFGSIVLVFSDVVQKTWPFLATQALSVVRTAGSSFMKNMTANVTNVVAEKTTGVTGSTYQSGWVHDTDLSSTDEMTRIVHTVDEQSEFATMSLGVLHTDGSLNKYIEPAIQMTSTQVVVSSQSSTDATRSAIFESTGLSFDSDESAVYFGSNKNFRIVFEDGTPALLKIQSTDGAGGYVTKTEFTDST